MRRLLAVLLLVCLPLSSSAVGDTTVIAAFGDSLFSGLGISDRDSFPDQLERRLKKDGNDVNVLNFGVSGDTSAGGVNRINWIVRQKPDVVLVEFGANDMLRGMAPGDTRANMERILATIHHAGIRMLVIGQKAPPSYGKQYVQAYDSLYCDLAKKYDAPCYPFFFKVVFGHADLMQADGMHPNAKGVAAIVDDIYPLIAPLMNKPKR